jgi:hypothetical protein
MLTPIIGMMIAEAQESGVFRLVSVNIPNGSTLLPDLYSLTYGVYLKFTFSKEVYGDLYPDESSYFYTNFLFNDLTIANPSSMGLGISNKKIVETSFVEEDRITSTPCDITILDDLLDSDLGTLDKEYSYSYPITLGGEFTYSSSDPTIGGVIPNDTSHFHITFAEALGDLSEAIFNLSNSELTIEEELSWSTDGTGKILTLTRPSSDTLPIDSYTIGMTEFTDIHGRSYNGGNPSYTVEEE